MPFGRSLRDMLIGGTPFAPTPLNEGEDEMFDMRRMIEKARLERQRRQGSRYPQYPQELPTLTGETRQYPY